MQKLMRHIVKYLSHKIQYEEACINTSQKLIVHHITSWRTMNMNACKNANLMSEIVNPHPMQVQTFSLGIGDLYYWKWKM